MNRNLLDLATLHLWHSFVYETYPQHKKNTAWTASSFHAYPSCDCMVFKVGGNLLHGSWQALHWGELTSGIFKWRTMTMLLMMCRFTSFQLISTYFIFATKLSKHDMHVCVGASPLMPRSQARCPWDEWAPEKCKKMPRKHKKAVLQRLVIRYKYCFFVLFPVLRWALHWLPWRSVRDLWAWRWGRVGKITWHLCLLLFLPILRMSKIKKYPPHAHMKSFSCLA